MRHRCVTTSRHNDLFCLVVFLFFVFVLFGWGKEGLLDYFFFVNQCFIRVWCRGQPRHLVVEECNVGCATLMARHTFIKILTTGVFGVYPKF